MQVLEVTNEDGVNMAHILNGLKVARFDGITGEDVEKLYRAKRWLSALAGQMAEQLKSKQVPIEQPRVQENATFKIKAMGPIGSNTKKKKKK